MTEVLQVNDDNFESEVLESELPTLVDFWAPRCGPCHTVAPVVEELASEYAGRIKVAKMNVDENPKTPTTYNIRGVPTLILFRNGRIAAQVVGAVPKARLEAALKDHV